MAASSSEVLGDLELFLRGLIEGASRSSLHSHPMISLKEMENRIEFWDDLGNPKELSSSGSLGDSICIHSVSQSTNIQSDPCCVPGVSVQGFLLLFIALKQGSSRDEWLHGMSGAEGPRYLQVSSTPSSPTFRMQKL